MAKKAASVKKEATPKKAARAKDVIARVHGATVFTMRGVDESTATVLIKDHGFRLGQRTDAGCSLFADKMAYDSWKAGT